MRTLINSSCFVTFIGRLETFCAKKVCGMLIFSKKHRFRVFMNYTIMNYSMICKFLTPEKGQFNQNSVVVPTQQNQTIKRLQENEFFQNIDVAYQVDQH